MSTETGIRRLHHAAGLRGPIGAWSLREGPAVVAGLMAPFVVALALLPFRTDLSHTDSALVFVVVVVAIASIGSRAAGLLAALSAAAWFDYVLTRPYWTFGITDSSDLGTALLLLVVGLIVSRLAVRARRLARSRTPTPNTSPASMPRPSLPGPPDPRTSWSATSAAN
ncbi:DUF4118 domain-containing protein [Streptomyces sp. HUAS TT11]|uniref:DUF4118 domain-containing protein n=1 Tax=Streptomyces sp. HUAS TT11 TaxID=3447508 RepID=UPI003F65E01A